MARRFLIAGNWKMHLGLKEAAELAGQVAEHAERAPSVDVAVAPGFCAIPTVVARIEGRPVAVAGQNCHWEPQGAFTGEVSAEMLADAGCTMVIIGHSERRQYFGETDETVSKKIGAALRAGLKPIVCVGETLEQRDADKTLEVVKRQFELGCGGLDESGAGRLVLAYEPVWAIGTGRTATPQQAQEVHAYLRGLARELYGGDIAESLRILYGGSVKPENASDLLAQPDIDGALVGGASLKGESFGRIIMAAESTGD